MPPPNYKTAPSREELFHYSFLMFTIGFLIFSHRNLMIIVDGWMKATLFRGGVFSWFSDWTLLTLLTYRGVRSFMTDQFPCRRHMLCYNGKIATRIGTRPSALHSTFHFWKKSRRIASFLMLSTSNIEKVTQNCFMLDVVKFKIEEVSQKLLRFWCCHVQKAEKVPHNSFIFKLVDRQIDRQLQLPLHETTTTTTSNYKRKYTTRHCTNYTTLITSGYTRLH